MATIRNGKISTTFKYVKIVGIPEISLEPLEREYSDSELESVASVSSSTSARAANERRKISRAEGCFITKQPGYHLERAHWVNVVRKNARLKYEVENLLIDLHIVRRGFSLEAPPNIAPLDRNLHYTLARLGFFAVTCSKETLLSLISLVEKENEEWQARDGDYTRRFEFDHMDAMYELVLMYPHHFLQRKGSALTVFTELGADLSGKMYFASPDGALRESPDNSSPRLPAFASNRARLPEDAINPFLVVLNAGIAFRRFKKRPHPLCADYTELIDLTTELVNKIYFQPLVDVLEQRRRRARIAYSTKAKGDVDMEETVDKFRTKKAGDKVKRSRMGTVVQPPGPDASHDEILMPDHMDYDVDNEDAEDDDDDDDYYYDDDGYYDDNVDDKGPLPELGLSTHSGEQNIHPEVTSPIDSIEKVKQWQDAAQ